MIIKLTRVEESQLIGEPIIETEIWLVREHIQRFEREKKTGGSFIVYMGAGVRVKESPEELEKIINGEVLLNE